MLTILISNDDGIHATGINVLAKRLALDPQFAVYVVAPDRERSATGHSLTLHKPLRFEKASVIGASKEAWLTSGTPSDCIKFGVTELLKSLPDIVISGINSSANLGSEILYSGTVAAAREGALLKIPSLAISLNNNNSLIAHYDSAAEFTYRLIHYLMKIKFTTVFKETYLLNINVPNLAFDKIHGVAITEPGLRLYNDQFERRLDPRGKHYYWLTGEIGCVEEEENTDIFAIEHKMISVSPIALSLSCRQTMEKLATCPGLVQLVSHEA